MVVRAYFKENGTVFFILLLWKKYNFEREIKKKKKCMCKEIFGTNIFLRAFLKKKT